MTAPRRSARPAPSGRRPLRPGSITLAFAALALAGALPVGAFAAAVRFDTAAAVMAATFGMVLVAVLAFLAATKHRAGIPVGCGGLVLPGAVAAGLIVTAYAGVAYVWNDSRGFDNDFTGRDVLVPLGVMAAATFIVMYATLSMARR